jgi:cell division ATPase FtsA
MSLTDAKRQKAYDMFGKGKTTHDVAKSLKISVASAAAMKANWTRNSGSNVYEITGTFWVEAPSRDSAIKSFRPARTNGSRVLDFEAEDVTKLSAAEVDELFV